MTIREQAVPELRVRPLPRIVERLLKRLRLYWIFLAYVSATLGYRRGDMFKLGLYHSVLSLAEFVHSPRPRALTVRLAPDGHKVVISGRDEIAVLHAIFLRGEYQPGDDPEVIFDVGANVGFATLFFSRCHPTAHIVAVEADPRTYPRLLHNVRELPNVTTVHRAVAGHDGSATFYPSSSSIGSSLTRIDGNVPAVVVPASRLDTLMNELGIGRIDLLKIDIEGAEFDVLATAPMDRIGEIVAEVHYGLGHGDEQTLRQFLPGFDLRFRELSSPDLALLHASRLAQTAEPQPSPQATSCWRSQP